MILNNQDFIFFGLQPWDIEIGCNPRNMALVMAKHKNRILYVNRPLDRISYLRKRNDKKIQARIASWKKGIDELSEVKENIYVLNPRIIQESINFLPQGRLFNRLNYMNTVRLANEVNKAVKKLDFKDPVILIDDDFIKPFYFKELIPHSLLVYYIRDYLISYPYFKRRKRLLYDFISKVDLVAANSAYLKEFTLKYNSSSIDIGQGCSVELFASDKHTQPEDIRNIRRPVIGYCGALIEERLDIGLLEKIAASRPDWSIVLVGKEDDKFATSALHNLSNVFFLGSKPFDLIPDYVKSFDVCINPQVINDITIGNYPLKIDEYLAAGKPVVATDTVAMKMFSEYVYLCNNADEYIVNLEKALKDEKYRSLKEDRKRFASSHTWEACVEKLYDGIIEKLHEPVSI